jgi:hypothetical protein
MVSWEQLAVQYAMHVLFETAPTPRRVYCYSAQIEHLQRLTVEKTQFVVGRVRLTSEITHDTAVLDFGVWQRGAQHLYGGARVVHEADDDHALLQEARAVLTHADFPAMIRLLRARFGAATWSLRALRRDAQRQLLPLILDTVLPETEAAYRQLYEPYLPLLRTLMSVRLPAPKALQGAAEYLLNLDIHRAFAEDMLDLTHLHTLLAEAGKAHCTLDAMTLQPAISQGLARLITRLVADPDDLPVLQVLAETMRLVRTLPFGVDLWKVQNMFYTLCHTAYATFRHRAEQGDPQARTWVHHCRALADLLSVRVD